MSFPSWSFWKNFFFYKKRLLYNTAPTSSTILSLSFDVYHYLIHSHIKTYISLEQAAFWGFSRCSSLSRRFGNAIQEMPWYGTSPQVKSSQIVIPNAHCSERKTEKKKSTIINNTTSHAHCSEERETIIITSKTQSCVYARKYQ